MLEKMKDVPIIECDDDQEQFIKIKITHIDYCQSCGRDFDDIELVFYAPLDNNIICKDCTCPHKEVEPRMYMKK